MIPLAEVFKKKKQTFSFEIFPAKTSEGHEKLLGVIKGLCALHPDFISCTYGAGGGSREKTLDVVEYIQKTYNIPAMAHLTCIAHTRDEIKNIVDNIIRKGIKNILAMRGDPPKDNPDAVVTSNNFRHSSDLVEFIRGYTGGGCSIAVAGFPEGHPLTLDRDKNAQFLKNKIDKGGDFVMTQLFFSNEDYFDYVKRLRTIGVNARVIPGILPITDYKGLIRFCDICKASIPEKVHNIFKTISDNPDAVLKAGIDFAVQQCRGLLDGGAPGIHFFTLNKVYPVSMILKAIRAD